MTEPILIFDGECGFCTSAAHYVGSRWAGTARAVAYQQLGSDGLAKLGLTTEQASRAAWWIDPGGRAHRGHLAVAGALRAAGGWHRVLGLAISVPPLGWVAALVYQLVARWRGHLPGRRAIQG